MSITGHFYHGSIRRYVVTFGTMFNGMTILRKDASVIDVPLTYAGKEKFYLRLNQNPELTKQEAIDLPRMGFVISDFMYDAERKQSSIGKFAMEDLDDSMHHKSMFLPVPYDFIFDLSIYARNVDDGLQILEQIVPFFKPSFNVTIVELEEMGVIRDVPIILDAIAGPIEDEGDFTTTRVVRWDLTFTLKGNLYGPVRQIPIIKKIYVDYHTSQDGEYLESIDERYKVAIDPETARPDDIWVYNEEIISAHTSSKQEIPSPTDDILAG